MADIVISFTTTAAQDEKLAGALELLNEQRTNPQPGEPALDPYPTVTAWLRAETIDRAKLAIRKYEVDIDVQDQTAVREAWEEATPEQKSQVKAILGLS